MTSARLLAALRVPDMYALTHEYGLLAVCCICYTKPFSSRRSSGRRKLSEHLEKSGTDAVLVNVNDFSAVALAAGASAGIIADIALFPLDLLKTHAQGKTAAQSAAVVEARGRTSPSCAAPAQRKTAPLPVTVKLAASRTEGAAAGTRPVASSRKCHAPAGAVPLSPKRGGVSAFYRGIAALAMGSMPSSAGFFVVYETAKERLKCLGRFSARFSNLSPP